MGGEHGGGFNPGVSRSVTVVVVGVITDRCRSFVAAVQRDGIGYQAGYGMFRGWLKWREMGAQGPE